jgi:hypothetical protein
MTQETEVIACPACAHLLRVPLDWLGQAVQCPECQARFQAPIRSGERLTDPVLLSRPTPPTPQKRPKFDALLLLPAFGLLFCGTMGIIVNGVMSFKVFDPVTGKEWASNLVPALRQAGFGAEEPPEDRDKNDAEWATRIVNTLRWVSPAATLLSAVVFAGGLSIAFRWNYRLAQLGCVLASVNFPNLCCVPGAVFGLWGLLMLHAHEGRSHFQR